MIRIIDGKRYNTKSSLQLASSRRRDDFRWVELYRTKKGNYFLATLTCVEGETDGIRPLPQAEAEEFFHKHSSGDFPGGSVVPEA